jgi:hypothetical protein
MVTKALKISLFLFVPLIVNGQIKDSSKIKRYTLDAGYQNFRTNDQNTSPLIYVANNGYIGFKIEKEKSNSIRYIGASLSIGSNQSKRFGQHEGFTIYHYDIHGVSDSFHHVINPTLSFFSVNLKYGFKKNITRTLRLGGELNDNFYFEALGIDSWFLNQLSINPVIENHFPIGNKQKISTYISTPVLSYIVRQPYTLDPSLPIPNYFIMHLKSGSSIVTLRKYQQINIGIQYMYKLNSGRELGLSYSFMWLKSTTYQPRNLKAYSNTFCITYKF